VSALGLLLLMGRAGRAAEPPPRPLLPPDQVEALQEQPHRCQAAVGVTRGERSPCTGTLVPAVDLLQAQLELDHLDRLELRYTVDTTVAAAELAAARQVAADLKTELVAAQMPPPWFERPTVAFGMGVALGVGAAVGVAWALPVR